MSLTLRQYSHDAAATAIFQPDEGSDALAYCLHKLDSEVGEISGKLGKLQLKRRMALGHNHGRPIAPNDLTPEQRQDLLLELGDCLWYISMLARLIADPHGTDEASRSEGLENVAQMNLAKLAARAKAGTIVGHGDGITNRTAV